MLKEKYWFARFPTYHIYLIFLHAPLNWLKKSATEYLGQALMGGFMKENMKIYSIYSSLLVHSW